MTLQTLRLLTGLGRLRHPNRKPSAYADMPAHLRRDVGLPEHSRADEALARQLRTLQPW